MNRDDLGLTLPEPIPLPAVRRRRRVSLLPILLLALAGGAIVADARLSPSPFWTVGSLEVEGNRSVSTSDLLDGCALHAGMPWWRVSRRKVSAFMTENPRVRSVDLSFTWPRDLRVKVKERESVLRIVGDNSLEVAFDGVLFASDDVFDPADLPLLSGRVPGALAPGRRLDFGPAAASWRELLEFGEANPRIWKEISEIHFDGDQDFQLFLREGHRVILWQSGINHDIKGQITEILNDLKRQELDDAVVDLRFRGQAVVRLPQGALADSAEASDPETVPKSPAAPGRPAKTSVSARTGGAGLASLAPAKTPPKAGAAGGSRKRPAAKQGKAKKPAPVRPKGRP